MPKRFGEDKTPIEELPSIKATRESRFSPFNTPTDADTARRDRVGEKVWGGTVPNNIPDSVIDEKFDAAQAFLNTHAAAGARGLASILKVYAKMTSNTRDKRGAVEFFDAIDAIIDGDRDNLRAVLVACVSNIAYFMRMSGGAGL